MRRRTIGAPARTGYGDAEHVALVRLVVREQAQQIPRTALRPVRARVDVLDSLIVLVLLCNRCVPRHCPKVSRAWLPCRPNGGHHSVFPFANVYGVWRRVWRRVLARRRAWMLHVHGQFKHVFICNCGSQGAKTPKAED